MKKEVKDCLKNLSLEELNKTREKHIEEFIGILSKPPYYFRMLENIDYAIEQVKLTEAFSKINGMDYVNLLHIWRHTPTVDNNPLLQGEIGNYFKKVMFEKKEKLSHEEQVAASKSVGW